MRAQYSIGYSAQTLAFVLLVTERYPTPIRPRCSPPSAGRPSIRCVSSATPTTFASRG